MHIAALGKRIYETRRKQGIFLKKLAELCDVGAVYICELESEAKSPGIRWIIWDVPSFQWKCGENWNRAKMQKYNWGIMCW